MTEENQENLSNRKVENKRPFQYRMTTSKTVNKYNISNSSIRRLSKRNKTKIELQKRINKEEMEEELLRMKKILRHASIYDISINALSHKPSERNTELNKTIVFFLKNMKNFMNIFSNETDEELEKILYDIASRLKYEKYEKNKIICKYGDIADRFYLILKGKVIFLVPKKNKHYLSEEEYIEYLLKLRKEGENELVSHMLKDNQLIFYLGEDFDEFVLNSLEKHEKNKENIYSKKIYNLFYEFKKFKEKEQKKINEIIDIQEYIKNTLILSYDNPEYAKLKKKKLITIYEYEKTNIFEDGYSFGAVGANNKTNKRTATSIAYEECHLGILTKEEYLEILEKVNSKARDRLFDLVFEHKIFVRMSKYTFINKYVHMFHFIKYYKNNIILNENTKFNKLIILYKGEYTLSINKNILELNELILKIKKIRGKMLNIPDEIVKKDLQEIDENKSLIISMRYSSKDIFNLIMKKQNYILSKIKEDLVLGYPNTIDPETNFPLFNCECISNYAFGYKVENDMLKLMEKDRYLRKNAPEIATKNIDLFLERLIELKKIIIGKIRDKQHYNRIDEIKIRPSNDINDENKDENNIEIKRNSSPKKNKTSSVLFDFNTKILSSLELGKTLKEKKPHSLSVLNRKIQTNSDTKEINPNEYNIKNFFSLIFKFKKNILEKNNLLRKVQRQSPKFLFNEKVEMKKIQMNLNKRKSKEEYNDISSIFAKNPHVKKTILDRMRKVKEKDNVLDPLLYEIKNQVKQIKIENNNIKTKDKEINKETDYISNESIYKFFNTFLNNTNKKYNTNYTSLDINKENTLNKNFRTTNHKNMKLNNLKIKNNFSLSCNKNEFSSYYKNTDYSISNLKSTDYSKGFNKTIINLNNINISKTIDNYFYNNNDYQDLYHMLYLKYITDELKSRNDYKKKYGKSYEKFKTLSNENYFTNIINNNNKKKWN